MNPLRRNSAPTRRRDSRLAAAFGASLVAVLGTALPGLASPTTATVVLTAGGGPLSISAPSGTVNLATASFSTGNSAAAAWPAAQVDVAGVVSALDLVADLKGQLGTVTVTDARTGLLQTWTARVSWTDFSQADAAGDATKIIEAGNIRYSAGIGSSASVGAFVPSVAPVTSGDNLGTYAGVAPLLTGSSTVTWNPTFFFDLQGEIAGTYTGTVTHSVS